VATGLRNARTSAGGDPIRVLSFIDNMDVGGTEMNAVRTAERLDRTRYDLIVATLRADGPLRARYEAAGIPIHEFSLGRLVGAQAVREGRRFAALLRDLKIEVVHGHDVYTNIFATPWARWAGVPLVIGSRRWWQDVNRPVHRVMNRLSYRLAHRVLANSPSVGELLVRQEGVPRERLLIIPNFVDDDAFESMDAATAAATRREFGVSSGELVVGIIANLRPVKDHATLLRAAARLARDWPNVRYVLVGEGSTRTALETQAAALGIADRVTLTGGRPHQPGVQQLFDIAVLCSTGEGFPNTVVEAMAAGRPVVATRVGGVQDAVVPEETGLLVPPGNDAALARAIDSLLKDAPRREAMGRAGRERARELYHAPSVMRLLHAAYDTVRSSRNASS
jgi:glycosyltransferase involved in cell wall biosynthesis